jgi:transposase
VRRRHWTDTDKIRIVEESLRGHRQGSATANRYGLSRSLLTRWRKEYRCGLLGAPEAKSFTAVAIADDHVPSALPAPATGIAEAVEITLTNGRRLTVGSSIEAVTLARLVQVLDRA